jgi:DNA-binding transcriptional ArsR family regulator
MQTSPQLDRMQTSSQLERLEQMAERFRVLSEPTRLRILDVIGSEELNVQEICDRTGFKQANVSRHLRLLKDVKAIACRQSGHFHYYRVVDPLVLKCWQCTHDYWNCENG